MIAAVSAVPLFLAALVPWLGRFSLRLLPWAPLPALLLLVVPTPGVELNWLLLGSRLGLDPVGRVFLLFGNLLWTCAGAYAIGYLRSDAAAGRFCLWWLLALAGYQLAVLAQDPISFYFGFTLMSLAAYGLVVHRGDAAALRAGRVYLVLTLLGEVAVLAGIMLGFAHGGGEGLLLLGLAVKAGLMPLHVWLPLAHPAAPAPASAVLSGVMIKVGLLGWLRVVAPGGDAWPEAGAVLLVAGLVSAYGGVLLGLTQREPKSVLAYSSISQMGMIAAVTGAALQDPVAGAALLPALLLYALHHGLAKGALFMGVALRGGVLYWSGMLLAALALAGAPFTSGALAKVAVKAGLGAGWLPMALSVAATGTTLLLGRLLLLLRTSPAVVGGGLQRASFAATVLASQLLAWWAAPGLAGKLTAPAGLWQAAWPVLLGLVLLAGLRLRQPMTLAAGDMVVVLERVAALTVAGGRRLGERLAALRAPQWRLPAPPARWERRLQRWSGGSGAVLAVLGLLALASLL